VEDIAAHVDVAALRAGEEAPVAVELSAGHAALSVKEVTPPRVGVRTVRPGHR
jgi:hypothetical protein